MVENQTSRSNHLTWVKIETRNYIDNCNWASFKVDLCEVTSCVCPFRNCCYQSSQNSALSDSPFLACFCALLSPWMNIWGSSSGEVTWKISPWQILPSLKCLHWFVIVNLIPGLKGLNQLFIVYFQSLLEAQRKSSEAQTHSKYF